MSHIPRKLEKYYEPGRFTLITPEGKVYKIESCAEAVKVCSDVAVKYYKKNRHLEKRGKNREVRRIYSKAMEDLLMVFEDGRIFLKKPLFSPMKNPSGHNLPVHLRPIYEVYVKSNPIRYPIFPQVEKK